MKQRQRIYYSAEQRAEIWDRRQREESMSSIGRRLDRQSSSIFLVLSPSGGMRFEASSVTAALRTNDC